jgi:hypothetical protein
MATTTFRVAIGRLVVEAVELATCCSSAAAWRAMPPRRACCVLGWAAGLDLAIE